MKTLHVQFTRPRRVIQIVSGLFQADLRCEFLEAAQQPGNHQAHQTRPGDVLMGIPARVPYHGEREEQPGHGRHDDVAHPIRQIRDSVQKVHRLTPHIIDTTSRHSAETVRNPAAQQISRIAGLPNAKFKIAPMIAKPGRDRKNPARGVGPEARQDVRRRELRSRIPPLQQSLSG